MTSLEELEKQREALLEDRYSGTKSMQDRNGRTIEFKSDRDMSAALADLEHRIAALKSKPIRRIRIISNKGA
ncbi:phage head-tail joining protein [Pseudovibrio denitrificans]|uniref:phage head-tail joining protein n=1 Tax=Pseudovibrio denitrificans TaxID=258256 RepID=UPI0039BF3E9E